MVWPSLTLGAEVEYLTRSMIATDPGNDELFCRAMLPRVSRTFALTIRLLPPELGYTVTVAYLLCRIADTIEDAATMDAASRVLLLSTLRDSLGDEAFDIAALSSTFRGAELADQILARDCDKVLREYWRLPTEEREAIRPSVQEMCDGMGTFVMLLAPRSGQKQLLESVAELEQYCYFVAGTVGHLLTRLFTLHMGEQKMAAARVERMWALSTRFALGLQLTNIVQDVAADAERGVVFVPRELLSRDAGTRDQHQVTHSAINSLSQRALACLSDAIDYCACLPRTQYRIRLFCLLAPYLAVQTLRAVSHRVKDGQTMAKAKISRGAVYRTVVMTVLVAPSNILLRSYFSLLSRGVVSLRTGIAAVTLAIAASCTVADQSAVGSRESGVGQTIAATASAPYVVVLGNAQDGGYPQAGTKPGDDWEPSRRRLAASLAIVDPISGERWLVEATPDFKEQLHQLDSIAPDSARPGLDGILLTHAHVGHYSGLIHLGLEILGARNVPVFAMPRMSAFLSRNGPWDQLVRYQNISLRPMADGEPVRLNERISVTPFRVPHRDEYSETVGFRIRGPVRTVVFLPDIDKWERWDSLGTRIEDIVREADVAYLDGTFYADGEVPGRSMAEIPHPFIAETMRRFANAPADQRARIRFIHLNRTNPAAFASSPERQAVEKAGFKIAVQGEKVGL